MIEIRERETSEDEYDLLVDGTIIEDNECKVSISGGPPQRYYHANVFSHVLASRLTEYSWAELESAGLNSITLPSSHTYLGGQSTMTINLAGHGANVLISRSFFTVIDVDKVPDKWSILDYYAELRKLSPNFNRANVDVGLQTDPFSITIGRFPFELIEVDGNAKSRDIVTDFDNSIYALHNAVLLGLDARPEEKAVSLRFEFPEAVKTPCEQYLLYFAQFLKDSGVEATTDLKHEAAGVLFTVTPADKDQALDKIREALNLYMSLPTAAPLFDAPAYNESLAIQRYVAEVEHLRSQIRLANAERIMLASTIQNQQAMMGRMNEQITTRVLIESQVVPSAASATEDTVPVLGGLVKIKNYDAKVADINLPMLARGLTGVFAYVRDLFLEPQEPANQTKDVTFWEE